MKGASIGIGLLGLGTIGTGVYKLLRDNGSQISQRVGNELVIKRVLERDQERALSLGVQSEKLAKNIEEILDDPEIQIVVELLGGTEPARTYIYDALGRGKHVVTANKDVISAHGKELYEAAAAGKADLYFEAQSIALALQGVSTPRPMTHDLMKTVCDNLGASVRSVEINDVHDGTYYAKLYIQTISGECVLDSRPSDAIALALRAGSPIYISEKVAQHTLSVEELIDEDNQQELRKVLGLKTPEDIKKSLH